MKLKTGQIQFCGKSYFIEFHNTFKYSPDNNSLKCCFFQSLIVLVEYYLKPKVETEEESGAEEEVVGLE